MDSGSASQGVQGCPSPGMAERGEGSGTGNGGCNRTIGGTKSNDRNLAYS